MKLKARPPRNPESGFAVLFIYLMAAIIAIGIYYELPRRAFEAQRERELLLIDRGEEYRKAVEKSILYRQKAGGARAAPSGPQAAPQASVGALQYPKDKDELEKQNSVRFLRHRFVDPITRKDDWLIVKINAQGQLVVEGQENSISENPNMFLNNPASRLEQQEGNNPGLVARPSDRTMPTESETQRSSTDQSQFKVPDPIELQQRGQPSISQGGGQVGVGAGQIPGQIPGQSPNPVQGPIIPIGGTLPGAQPVGQPGPQPGGTPSTNPFENNGSRPVIDPRSGRPIGAASGGGSNVSPQPGAPQPGAPPTFNPNSINQTLLNGQNGTRAQQTSGTLLGAGVAGVVSKSRMDSIVIYNEKRGYKNWMFVVDQEYLQKRQGNTRQNQPAPPEKK